MKPFLIGVLVFVVIAIPSLVFGIIYWNNLVLEQFGRPLLMSIKWVTPFVSILVFFIVGILAFIKKIPAGMTTKSRLIALILLALVTIVYLTWIATGYITALSTLKVNNYSLKNGNITEKYIKREPTRSGSYDRYFVRIAFTSERHSTFEVKSDVYAILQENQSYRFILATGRFGHYFYNKQRGLIDLQGKKANLLNKN